MENISLPGQIKLLLKALNLNQTGLASKLGLSQGVISEFASGAREPSKEFLIGLPKLGVSLDWFLLDKGEMFLQNAPQRD
jgi:transcriptional regulator with XRE-family HTH domain